MSASGGAATSRVAIILHSGSYDRVAYALSMATVTLAMGCDVRMLVTYEALWRFTKGRLQEMGDETPAAVRERIERGLTTGGIQPLAQVLAGAKELGLKVYACPNAMGSLNIVRTELAPEVDGAMGLAAFMEFALGGANTWYI